MAIEFVCPTCNGTLRVADDAAGRVIRCGGCLSTLRVPAADPATAPPDGPFGAEPPAPPARRARPDRDEPRPDPPRRRRDRDRDRDEDDFDRPRRRRDDESPPPPGRGVFFWLVIIGTVLFLGLLSCCGLLWWQLPKENWHWHESQQGGFKVEMPADPQPNVEDAAGIKLDKGTRAEGTVRVRGLQPEHFLVVYRDIPGTKDRVANGGGDEKELDERTDRVLGATQVQGQVRQKSITVDGFPGRELEYKGKGGKYTVRIIVADTRLYIVMAGGQLPHGSPDVRRFVESFHVTDPKLVDEGKKREKEGGKKEKGKDKDD
jgi:hypothetical protein